MIGQVHALSGEFKEARAITDLESKAAITYVWPYYSALLYSALGDRTKMLAALRRGYADHCWTMATLKVEPKWNASRSDSEFQAIVAKMRFP
jgi:hypothetical protein